MIQYSFITQKGFLASKNIIMKSQHFKVKICVFVQLHFYVLPRATFTIIYIQYYSFCHLLVAYPSSYDKADDMKVLQLYRYTGMASSVREKMTSFVFIRYIVYSETTHCSFQVLSGYYLLRLLQNKTCKTGKNNSNEKQIFTN